MQYFIIENQQQSGPFSVEQLALKNITAETLVWADGMQDWTPAWKVDELKDIISSQPTDRTTNTTPPPYTPPTPNQQFGDNAPKKQDNKKLLIIASAVVFIFLLFSTCTNPDKQKHEDCIKQELTSAIDKATDIGSNDIISQRFSMVSKMITGNLIDSAVDNLLEYHNYLFYSKCTVNYNGEDHTISYGFFGKVWTANADDIYKAISKNNSLLQDNNALGNSDVDDQNEDNSEENVDDNTNKKSSITEHIQDKADETANKIANHVSERVNKKIDEKLDEMTDSSTIEKLVDKILKLI